MSARIYDYMAHSQEISNILFILGKDLLLRKFLSDRLPGLYFPARWLLQSQGSEYILTGGSGGDSWASIPVREQRPQSISQPWVHFVIFFQLLLSAVFWVGTPSGRPKHSLVEESLSGTWRMMMYRGRETSNLWQLLSNTSSRDEQFSRMPAGSWPLPTEALSGWHGAWKKASLWIVILPGPWSVSVPLDSKIHTLQDSG